MPVAIAEIDRQIQPGIGEVGLQRRDDPLIQRVDRRDPTEVQVVLRDLGEPFGGHPATPSDVLQEGDHVLGTLGTAEGQQQQGVGHQLSDMFSGNHMLWLAPPST